MSSIGKFIGRALMVAVPIALGVGAILYSGKLNRPPAPSETARQPVPVRVITVEPLDLVARVSAYGTVAPAREWRAVARIEGEVSDMGDGLAAGVIVGAGELLFRIDDSDLRLDLAGVDAQLAASAVRDRTIRASLGIAQADLALAEEDLARQEQLTNQGVVTRAALDATRRQSLVARTKVTELQNQIDLNAAEREVLMTQRASLERALGFAAIRAPFDMRISALEAFAGQYVNRGQVLLAGEGIEAAEITAQFPMGRIGPLLRLAGEGTEVTDLAARVVLPGADHPVSWAATVDRMGDAIDERTQSAPLIVRVTDPQSQSAAGKRPPLRRNMVVGVTLSAPERKALVVPTEAVQGGTALVVTEAGTLEMRPVQTGFVSGTIAIVAKGLEAGDKLVITDPTIAVPGMAVKPVEDAARKAAIAAAALGEAPAAGNGTASGAGTGSGTGAGKGNGNRP